MTSSNPTMGNLLLMIRISSGQIESIVFSWVASFFFVVFTRLWKQQRFLNNVSVMFKFEQLSPGLVSHPIIPFPGKLRQEDWSKSKPLGWHNKSLIKKINKKNNWIAPLKNPQSWTYSSVVENLFNMDKLLIRSSCLNNHLMILKPQFS